MEPRMEPARKKARLSTGELDYFVLGEGRPLLYLHSSAGVAWTPVLAGLARNHALHVPVIPGYDGSPLHAGVTDMPALGRLLGEFINQTFAGNSFGEALDVIGHSFGGRAALWTAIERPQAIDHLVLEAPSGFAPNGSFPTDPETLRKRMFAHPEKRPAGERSPHLAANRRSTDVYLKGQTFDAELQSRLSSVQNKTLILQGTADLICPREGVQSLKAKLPKAWLVYIWDAAHAPETDQPERVLKVVGDFLEKSEAFVVNWETARA